MRINASPSYRDLQNGPTMGCDLVPLSPATPLVPVSKAMPEHSASAGDSSLLRFATPRIDVHNLSPRRMAKLSQDLYVSGVISFDDYSALAFQPELHPDFDRTIGALTGERAAPDESRDFVRVWEERLDFDRRHNPINSPQALQSERIIDLLIHIDHPTDVSI